MSEYNRCQQVKDNGDRCGSTTNLNPENGLCLWHDPEREEQRRAVQAQGGKSTAKKKGGRHVVETGEAPPPPETMSDCAEWAAWAAHAVATGKLDPRTGGEVSKLLNSFRSALEKAESREELAELREKIEAATKRGNLKAVD